MRITAVESASLEIVTRSRWVGSSDIEEDDGLLLELDDDIFNFLNQINKHNTILQ